MRLLIDVIGLIVGCAIFWIGVDGIVKGYKHRQSKGGKGGKAVAKGKGSVAIQGKDGDGFKK